MGLTTIDDCGLDAGTATFIEQLQQNGKLRMRLYVMLSDNPANFSFLEKRGKIKTDRLNIRSIKVYADGALGSRGACLLHPYADKPGWSGFLLSPPPHFDSVAAYIARQGWQMCTHAIGDSGNRTILNIYCQVPAGQNDLRWRIEHAQVVNPADFSRFGANNIIPSVQPTHATSDMYWAGDRLGPERVKRRLCLSPTTRTKRVAGTGHRFPGGRHLPFQNLLRLRRTQRREGLARSGLSNRKRADPRTNPSWYDHLGSTFQF